MTAPNDVAALVELARRFHETYERLAPQFGYETRAETKTFDPHSPNGKLMIAVCSALYPASALEASEAKIAALTAENATLREERDTALKSLREWKHTATNRFYMMEAYHAMLGPVALEVAAMWQKAGVVRQHTSWGPEAFTVSGEQRAQWILDWENAPKRRCIDIDKGIYEDDPPHSGQEKADLRAALRQEGKP